MKKLLTIIVALVVMTVLCVPICAEEIDVLEIGPATNIPTVEDTTPPVADEPTAEDTTPPTEDLPPVEDTTPPEADTPPVEDTTPPEADTPPVEDTTPPAENLPPVEDTTPPMEDLPPVEDTTPPEADTPPVEDTTPPMEDLPPVENTTPPEADTPPVEDTTPPATDTPPVEDTTPPEADTPPVEDTTPPEADTPPVEDTTPPEADTPAVEEESVAWTEAVLNWIGTYRNDIISVAVTIVLSVIAFLSKKKLIPALDNLKNGVIKIVNTALLAISDESKKIDADMREQNRWIEEQLKEYKDILDKTLKQQESVFALEQRLAKSDALNAEYCAVLRAQVEMIHQTLSSACLCDEQHEENHKTYLKMRAMLEAAENGAIADTTVKTTEDQV